MFEVRMPQKGLTETSAYLSKWYVKVGDTVKTGDYLFAMETSKSVFDVEAEEAGTVIAILYEEGDEVEIEKVVCVIGEAGETYEGAADSAPAAAPAQEEAPAAPAPAPTQDTVLFDRIRGNSFLIRVSVSVMLLFFPAGQIQYPLTRLLILDELNHCIYSGLCHHLIYILFYYTSGLHVEQQVLIELSYSCSVRSFNIFFITQDQRYGLIDYIIA